MKRVSIVVLLAACVVLGYGGFVYAGTDLGQHCFLLVAEGQSATLRIAALQADGPETMIGINARWRAVANGSAYQLLGAGTVTPSHPPAAGWSMDLTFFSGNSMCALHAELDGSLNGSFLRRLDCVGLSQQPLTVTGTITLAACTSAM